MQCVQKWLEELKDTSHVTWRISKTLPEGRINLFKQHLYCQHAADKRVSGMRSSKSTGCSATLQITVHRCDILMSTLHCAHLTMESVNQWHIGYCEIFVIFFQY